MLENCKDISFCALNAFKREELMSVPHRLNHQRIHSQI
jgi:hypothetical protein